MNLDAAEVRQQTRIGWWLAVIISVAAAALGSAAIWRGTIFGLHLDAVWPLPFTVGGAGFLAYLVRRALQRGVVLTRGGIVERTTRPRAFYLFLAFMAVMACALLVITAALIHFDPRRSRVG